MDPLTQGVVGAVVPQAVARGGRSFLLPTGLGLVAGMAPDLDVLIRSSSDPLLFLTYHRQFSHALIFIPLGGLILAGLYCLIFRQWDRALFLRAWLFASLGYGTHGLLDACTSYGTQLFWPFSATRVSFAIISIVDPLFTLPILGFVALALWRRARGFAVAGVLWGVIYLSAGVYQHHLAEAQGRALAVARGHQATALVVKPSFANLLVWRVIYEAEGRYYIDAVRVGIAHRLYEGVSLAKLDLARDFPTLDPASQQAKDIERFRWFSRGYIARAPKSANRIIDVRYAMVPNEVDSLWSITIDRRAGPDAHAQFETHRHNSRAGFTRLWQMIKGGTPVP